MGERNILMWLVAPSIPTAIREFLDRIGIEYSEIHAVHFRRVADRHGVTITSPSTAPTLPEPRRVRAVHGRLKVDEMPVDGYQLLPSVDKQKLTELIGEFEAAVRRRIDKSLAVRLRQEILEPEVPALNRATILQLARWCNTENPLYWDGMAVAQKISNALFGLVLDRRRLGT